MHVNLLVNRNNKSILAIVFCSFSTTSHYCSEVNQKVVIFNPHGIYILFGDRNNLINVNVQQSLVYLLRKQVACGG